MYHCYYIIGLSLLRGSGEVGGMDDMLNALPLDILDRDVVLYVFNVLEVY